MNYAVVIFPNQEVQEFANRLRKRYDPNFALIAPHIKIREPFEVDEPKAERLANYLKKTAASVAPFTIQFHKVSHFHPTNNVLYLAIKPSEPLHHLHQQLHDNEWKQKPKYDFVPHLTIGQNMTDDELHDVYSRLRMRDIEFTTKVEQIHLVRQRDNGIWEEADAFALES